MPWWTRVTGVVERSVLGAPGDAAATSFSMTARAECRCLIVHVGELGARKLHCAEGPGSLFRYCTDILRLSEAAASNRTRSARAARRFPVILDMLADGRVSMTTICLLS